MKLLRYPLHADGTPLDLLTGVVTDATGNNGAKTPDNYGPDGAPIDAVGLILVDKDGNTISFGGIESFATRAALAVGATATDNKLIYLAEAGREGVFEFDSSNLSSIVAVDTQQGLYIAPSGDTTGASGAWVRRNWTELNPRWFGAVADNVTNDSPAFNAMFRVAEALSINGSTNGTIYRGGPNAYLGVGKFYCATAWEPLTTMKIRGAGGLAWGAGTQVRFPVGTDGIIAQAHNTSGTNTLDGVNHYAGDNLVIQDIYFLGPYAADPTVTVEAEFHGVRAKRRIHIERCTFDGFAGDGFFSHASFGSGAPWEGNTNVSRIHDCEFVNCRNGIYVEGGDVNAMSIYACSFLYMRQCGIRDLSFLGNHYWGHHFDATARNTWNNGTAGKPCSFVTQGGKQYFCIHGQEAGASVNAPTGTTSDNTWWGYWKDGGVEGGIPAWFNGINVRSGGHVVSSNLNSSSTFAGCHTETNAPSQFDQSNLVLGPWYFPVLVSGGSYFRNRMRNLRAASAGLWVDGQLNLAGSLSALAPENFMGPSSGATVTDGSLVLADRNAAFTIEARHYEADGSTAGTYGYLGFYNALGSILNVNGGRIHRFRQSGNDIVTIEADGLHAATDKKIFTAPTSATVAGLRLPHGVAPAAPQDGDLWTTTAGLFVRINGATQALGTGGVSDGDKGDITISGAGSVYTIDNTAVTFAKMQNVAAHSIPARIGTTTGPLSELVLASSQLVGRGATGNIAALAIGTGLVMDGTTLRTAPTEQTLASGATITPTFTNDFVDVTALAVAAQLANWSGTAIDAHGIVVRIKDNGVARALTYGTKYQAADNIALPSTTVVGKTHELGFIYNAALDKFICISTVTY